MIPQTPSRFKINVTHFLVAYRVWPFIIWLFLNIIWYISAHTYYYYNPTYAISEFEWFNARATGHLINLNFAIILLPIARNSVFQKVVGLPFEVGLIYHKFLGCFIYLLATFHGFSWYVYWAIIYFVNDNQPYEDCYKACTFASAIQPVGILGLLCWLLLTVMVFFAMPYWRRKKFELFYFIHHVFILIIGLAIVHSYLGQNRTFATDLLLYYVIPGLCLYLFDRSVRFVRSNLIKQEFYSLEPQQGGLICLKLARKNFKFAPGQFCFLNIPTISRLQWHPFSITSSPSDDFLTFHIKAPPGDTWSRKLYTFCNQSESSKLNSGSLLRFSNAITVKCDGPYGNKFFDVVPDDIHRYFFICAGIGITPVISIINTIINYYQRKTAVSSSVPLKERIGFINLVWIVRFQYELAWFSLFLARLTEITKNNQAVLARQQGIVIKVNLYVTKPSSKDTEHKLVTLLPDDYYGHLQEVSGRSLNSFTEDDIHFHADGFETDPGGREVTIDYRVGRPNILTHFEDIRVEIAKHEWTTYPTRISTFVSVPEELEKQIAAACKQYSDQDVKYVFSSETFML